MYYDLTLKITPEMRKDANGNDRSLAGHLGTHFDVMDKEFPLSNLRLPAVVFDVSRVRGRDIEETDIDLNKVKEAMFVAFYTGYLDEFGYGTRPYQKDHLQLSTALIKRLLDKNINIIGIDCTGVRSGKEHTPTDQYCANNGVFIIENMCGMEKLLDGRRDILCAIHTYPVNFSGMTGLPCRVVAER